MRQELRQKINDAEHLQRAVMIAKLVCTGVVSEIIDHLLEKDMTPMELRYRVRRAHSQVCTNLAILGDIGLIKSKMRSGKNIYFEIDRDKVKAIRSTVERLNYITSPETYFQTGVRIEREDNWCACGRMAVCGFNCESEN